MDAKNNTETLEFLGNPLDLRKKPMREIVIFSPVGDMGQLEEFVALVRRLKLDSAADFLFIYRHGLTYKDYGLSALHLLEKSQIGTSGAFFGGQAQSCLLGYDIIVVADLDAFLDSRETFDALLEIAREKRVAAVPLSKSQGEGDSCKDYFVVNQWGVFPRQVFEKIGFEAPYSKRGGEDWEFANRLKSRGLVTIYRGGSVAHAKQGIGVLEKIRNPKKYYPYLKGLLVAFVVASSYDFLSYLRFFAWFCYYDSYATMLDDSALRKTVRCCDFGDSDIKPRESFKPSPVQLLSALLHLPLSAFGALMTLRMLKAQKMEIPTLKNLRSIRV